MIRTMLLLLVVVGGITIILMFTTPTIFVPVPEAVEPAMGVVPPVVEGEPVAEVVVGKKPKYQRCLDRICCCLITNAAICFAPWILQCNGSVSGGG